MKVSMVGNRPSLVVLLASGLIVSACSPEARETPSDQELLDRSEVIANQFQAELQAELQTALSEVGPIDAIGVCQSAAPAIAKRLSEESGIKVQRIARKNRNPEGALSADLERLYSQLEAAPLENGAPREVHMRQDDRFTYLRSIPMREQCTVCHGTSIEPDLEAAITSAYPQDRAIGFEPGDLRGAFLIEMDQFAMDESK